jgi:NEDD8-activating enzyme E1
LKEGDLQLSSPSIATSSTTLYMPKPPALEKATRKNLDKPLSSLVSAGEQLSVTDPAIQGLSLTLSIQFEV